MSGPPVYSFRKKVSETNKFKYTNLVGALETITVPATGTNDFIIDWGDGSATEHITTASPFHEYVDADSYQISINGTMTIFAFNNGGNKLNITSLDQWGNVFFTSLADGFRGCLNLITIPDGPITGANSITNVQELFKDTVITSIPSGLFDNNTIIDNFIGVFRGCPITSIPSGLFDNNVVARFFDFIFFGTNITSIPSGLFDNNVAAVSFAGAFRNTLLTSIANNLFINNILCTDFNRVFNSVSGGIVLPSVIFDLSSISIVTNFDLAFGSAGAGFTGTAQDIWNYALSATSVNTYLNQTNISNYADIPNDWKGL